MRRLLPKVLIVGLALGFARRPSSAGAAEAVRPVPRSATYRNVQRQLAQGWNSWSTYSLLSQVHLPDGFGITLGIKPNWLGGQFLGAALKSESRLEKVKPGPHADDGAYTSLEVAYQGVTFTVESGHDGQDLVMLVSAQTAPDRRPALTIEEGLFWNRPGSLGRRGDRLEGQTPAGVITVGTTAPLLPEVHAPLRAPYLAVALDGEVGIFTGRSRTLAEIKAVLAARRRELEKAALPYKDLAEAFRAMQTALAWNVIYDPENDRVIAPVSRNWNINFQGYVLFDWDTYFASVMLSLYNRSLAYANAVEITKSITPGGFIPNFASAYQFASFDRSQPPVGSRIIKEIYRRYQERWLLEETYPELLTWNRWWPGHRDNRGFLSWGTDKVPATPAKTGESIQFAKFESGLDNAPMFDKVPLKPGTGLLELGDVGLMSLYVMDCDALADIATVLGKTADAKELRARGTLYRQRLQGMWNEERGIFLDRRTDTGAPSQRLSPTHFYPLLARAATQAQAERMMKEHYFNPTEFAGEYVIPSIARNDPAFRDNNYWRGRIWAPMNYLVYLGLRNYQLPAARRDLVDRSLKLLMKSWQDSRSIHENYNGTTGVGPDVHNSDSFYHWGALLGFISFIERGTLAAPEAPLH